MKYISFLFICLGISLSSCTNSNSKKDLAALTTNTQFDSIISKRQLRRNGFQKREILVIYNTEDNKLKEKYNSLLENVSKTPQQGRFTITTKYKSLQDVTNEELKNNVLLLVGIPNENELIKEFTKTLPLKFSNNTVTFNNNTYDKSGDIFSLQFYPNPKNNTLPFSIITGNDSNNVYEFLEKRMLQNDGRRNFFRSMDYEVFRDGSRVTMGNFDNYWQIDPKVHFDYSIGNESIATTKHYNFISHQDAIPISEIKTLVKNVEESTSKILSFIEPNKPLSRIDYHIYKTAEDKGLMLGNTEQAHFNLEDNTVHTIINDKYRDNYIQKENELILKKILGDSKVLGLQRGLSVYFTTQWQREGYKYWTGRLAKSNNALSIKELFDNELVEKESNLVIDCISAALVDFLVSKWGKAKFLERYSNWTPNASEINTLQDSWNIYLKQLADQVNQPKLNSEISYLKGFNFAHEGYSIYNGYLSRKATEALIKQKHMGSNAITLVPYSYMGRRGNNSLTYLPFNRGAGSENDQGMIHSAYEAKQLGMSVLLKPQVLTGGNWGWSGDIAFETEAQWQAFFDSYYRWIRHYAFIAEIHGIDMLSIGVEFSKATLTHEANWAKMIKKLRGFYSGKLTYCANWGEEFESINLWQDLDFIGINSYYPLSDKNDASDAELKATFESVKEKISTVYNKYKKPIVFTEIGFRSLNAPWKLPYSDGDNNIFNEEHQDRAYKVIFEGIQNEPWCSGILWWKFPSYLEYRGRENTAFTPNNKKAEATVKKWFTEIIE